MIIGQDFNEVKYVGVRSKAIFMNIDSPEDYQKLKMLNPC